MTKKASVGILGGGITGLCIAYGLQKEGVDAVVYEKNNLPGGVIHSVDNDGWLVEKGPNTLMARRQEIWDLLQDLELEEEIRKAGETAKKRFIVKDRILVPLPLSLTEFLGTNLLSASAKLRLLKEPFVPASKKHDESVAAFTSRRLGREPLDYGVDPFVSGVYAGNTGSLSVKHTFSSLWELEQAYGSLARGAFGKTRNKSKTERALVSFAGGMQTLPRALHRRLGETVMCNTEVRKLTQTRDGWVAEVQSPDGITEQKHEVIISTVPIYLLHGMLDSKPYYSELSLLSQIPYASLSIVALGFRREQIGHPLDGFGMLIPGAEDFRLLGTLFSSSLFPNRAPQGHVLLTSFIGGARHPELARKPTKELMTIAVQELSHLLNIRGTPVFAEHMYWKQAIPQYEVGYDDYLDAMKKLEEGNPGLFLAGNFRKGVSVPDCIAGGIETARRAAMFLSS